MIVKEIHWPHILNTQKSYIDVSEFILQRWVPSSLKRFFYLFFILMIMIFFIENMFIKISRKFLKY
jgi:hypothetical protein